MVTYTALARRFYGVARSHLNPLIPFAIDGLIGAATVAMLLLIGTGWGVRLGAVDERQRHVESLRRIVPVAEEALAAHEAWDEAMTDTLEMLPEVGS